MATVKQYVTRLRTFAHAVGVSMGCDLSMEPINTRVLGTAVLADLAVVLKVLVDKGVVTDAELTAAFDAAQPIPYDNEPGVP